MLRLLLTLVLMGVAYVYGYQEGSSDGFHTGIAVEHALHAPENNPEDVQT